MIRIVLVPRLEVNNVVMEFPGVRALGGVSIAFEPGEVHGVVGENGAGKSTLMKILGGVQRATSGEILLDGVPVDIHGVRGAIRHGIAMIHQELNLVDDLTVAENVFLGRELTHTGVLNRSKMVEETQLVLSRVHASFPPTAKVGTLSIAARQLVEIAKAVALNAAILIMDEPTAVLSEPEAEALFELIAKLKAHGTTVIYISHRLPEVCAICDRITVLRDGNLVTTVLAENANPIELAGLMVGRPLEDFYPPKLSPPEGGRPLFEVNNVRGASFAVASGEILGIAGLVGAGRTELAEAIFGALPGGGGQVKIDGRPVKIHSPREAGKHGIAYVSEDRKGLGLHLTLSAIQNITLANLAAFGAIAVDRAKELEAAKRWKTELDIRVADLQNPVESASGGNQQKISIGKWLETKPRVLILDEPTRGVDVGAKRELYALIQRLATDGLACIVISSELSEIIGLCNRALVMRDGKIVVELSGTDLTEEAVMHYAAGAVAA